MATTDQLRELAKQQTRETFARSSAFAALGADDQRNLFRDTFKENYRRIAGGNGSMPGVRAFADPPRASDMIDDARHENRRIEQAGELAGEFIDEVDFPQFVKDLLEAVFEANLNVTLSQQESFLNLLKTASASISKFINEIDDTAAFGHLAENNSDEFNIDFPDADSTDDTAPLPKPILTDKDGNPVDTEDTRVKTRIMEAKIEMARMQKNLLQQTMLMGINRLIIQEGNVRASVIFDIKASERIDKADKAALKEVYAKSGSMSGGGGLIGKIFGGISGGGTTSKKRTRLSVSSAKSTAQTEMQARLAGSVDITFKSDVFPLERFVDLLAPPAQAGAPGVPAGAAPAAPAGVAG